MPKFGVFRTVGGQPMMEYDGDYMIQDKQFVKIMKRARSDNEVDRQVAAIHLDKAQSVKEIE